MELITITTFDNPIDAHILKSKLESENIRCYLFDENIVGLNPLYNISVGGIKLKVNSSEVDKATAIMKASLQASPLDDRGELLACPNCRSHDMYSGFKSMKGIKGLLSAIVSFMFGVFPIYFKTVHKCKSCGCEFK